MSPIVREQYQARHRRGHPRHDRHARCARRRDRCGLAQGELSPGLGRPLGWIARRVGEASALIFVEGTGSYGAILTDRLELAGYRTVEAASMPAGDRRGNGKSDALGATRVARAVL